jgi:4a-hydroxytetrahydrobiopterin dehydratase
MLQADSVRAAEFPRAGSPERAYDGLRMARPQKLEPSVVEAWLAAHPGWERVDGRALARALKFADFAAALAFVVRLGLAAEKRDHHPDVELGWGRVRVLWSTHDAGGITQLDLDLAEATEKMYG